MTSTRELESIVMEDRKVEIAFAGDSVLLAGQIDYPESAPPPDGYPLIFVLHHAGGNTRSAYAPYAQVALEEGYAVFRWDKRGTGRSGAGGHGSTTQDAIKAYATALEQPFINPEHTVILAFCSGSVLLGAAFQLFAQIQPPYGVLLVGNKLDESAILAIDTRLKIIMGERDWVPWRQYARSACAAHNAAYPHNATFHVVPQADRLLLDSRSGQSFLHDEAKQVIQDWLSSLCPVSASI